MKKHEPPGPEYAPWQLAAMKDAGYMDTSTGIVNRVASYLSKSPNHTTAPDEFRKACIACGADPDSFTQNDLDRLHKLLHRL